MPTPLGLPWQVAIGTNGQPIQGAKLYAYRAGSGNVLQTVYADPAYQTALPNPVVADAYGAFPPIYLDARGPDYRLVLTDRNGAEIPGRQADNIAAAGTGSGSGGGTGESAFYVVLSRQTTTVPADSAGVVSSFASANGTIRAFNGGLDVTDLTAFAVTQQTNCTGTVNATANTPVAGQPVGYYAVSAMTADTCELRITATYGTRSVDAVFTVVKAKAGAQGTPGAPGGGDNSIALYLTRDSSFVPAYADGTVVSYADAFGLASMYDGSTDVTASTTWSVTATGCTGTINTADNTPVNGQSRGYYRVTAMTTDPATLTITGTYNSVTLNRTFTVSKLKGGYEIVGTLPVTNLFQGRLVFLTTDNKLYRYTGSAWTAAIPAVDISGLLADAQIAAIAANKVTGLLTDAQIQSIAAAKLTGQITATQITDGAISTPKLAAGSVTANTIAAGTITGDKIAAQTITGNNILALTISGDKIAANTIAGDRIIANSLAGDRLQAGSITTDKISAGAVTAAQINVTSLSSLSANLGTVTAGTVALASSGHIRAGQTAYNTGTGFFLGFDGSIPRFSIGSPTGSYLLWDGTQLRIRATLDNLAVATQIVVGSAQGFAAQGAVSAIAPAPSITSGTGPYTYSWMPVGLLSGAGMPTISDTAVAAPTFSRVVADGTPNQTTWQLTVTDSTGAKASAIYTVTLQWTDLN